MNSKVLRFGYLECHPVLESWFSNSPYYHYYYYNHYYYIIITAITTIAIITYHCYY